MNFFPFKTFVFDCETTHLLPEGHQLLTLGGVLLDEELDEMGDIELAFKYPQYNVHPDALRVNKIDIVEHDRIALPPYNALDRLRLFLPDSKVAAAGWNVGFDVDWFWSVKQQYMPEFNPFFMRHGGAYAQGVYAIDIYALAVAMSGNLNIKAGGVHTALADARIEADYLRRIMKQIRTGVEEVSGAFIGTPGILDSPAGSADITVKPSANITAHL